jgi:hypothetical protein
VRCLVDLIGSHENRAMPAALNTLSRKKVVFSGGGNIDMNSVTICVL